MFDKLGIGGSNKLVSHYIEPFKCEAVYRNIMRK